MAVDDIVRLTVKGKALAQDHLHTLHFRYRTTSASETDLLADWQATCMTAYRGMFQGLDHVVQLLTAQQVCGTGTLRAPAEATVSSVNGSGTRANYTQSMPPWFAAIVSERTALAGRSRRGRFYIGGISEADQDGGNLNSTYLALVQAYIDALYPLFVNPNSNPDYTLVVWSEKLRTLPGSTCASSSTPVTNMLARSEAGTMKSRKVGSGS